MANVCFFVYGLLVITGNAVEGVFEWVKQFVRTHLCVCDMVIVTILILLDYLLPAFPKEVGSTWQNIAKYSTCGEQYTKATTVRRTKVLVTARLWFKCKMGILLVPIKSGRALRKTYRLLATELQNDNVKNA